MVFSLFQLRGRFLHRGRLRAGVAAPHPVFGKKSWDCFLIWGAERLAVGKSSIHVRLGEDNF